MIFPKINLIFSLMKIVSHDKKRAYLTVHDIIAMNNIKKMLFNNYCNLFI